MFNIRDVHGMGTIGVPWVPWDSHGNRSDNDNVMGNGSGSGNKSMGIGKELWECEWISITAI